MISGEEFVPPDLERKPSDIEQCSIVHILPYCGVSLG